MNAQRRRETNVMPPIYVEAPKCLVVGQDLADDPRFEPPGGWSVLMPPVEVEPRMAVFESELSAVKTDVIEIKSELKAFQLEMAREFRELNVKLAGRPSWAVLSIITVLSSAAVGSMVALATTGLS